MHYILVLGAPILRSAWTGQLTCHHAPICSDQEGSRKLIQGWTFTTAATRDPMARVLGAASACALSAACSAALPGAEESPKTSTFSTSTEISTDGFTYGSYMALEPEIEVTLSLPSLYANSTFRKLFPSW